MLYFTAIFGLYGECDGLLEAVVSGLERHENLELPSITVKSRLLTDEDVDMWDAYKAIGTIDEFKALKEKAEPKKAIILERRYENGDEVCVDWKCPVCGLNVVEEPPCQEYCQRCGNKLDWN